MNDPRASVWQAADLETAGEWVDVTLPTACQDASKVDATKAALATVDVAAAAKGQETTYQIGNRVFHLDRGKAEAAYAAKRVINGRESLTFNLLPLRYEWAYHLYKEMKQAHWGPMSAEIQMNLDAEQWNSGGLNTEEKGLVALSLGWLASLPRLPGAGLQHGIRMHVTAPELKLVLGREPQDANTRLEALLFAAQVFGLDLHECEARFRQAAMLAERQEWLRPHEQAFVKCQDLQSDAAQGVFARAVFLAGPCLKGMAFFSLHLMMAELESQGKCPGLGRMMSKIRADEACYLDVFKHLLAEAGAENAALNTEPFCDELRGLLSQSLELEKAFLRQMQQETEMSETRFRELEQRLDQLADARLRAQGLTPLALQPPLPPALADQLHVRVGQLDTGRAVLTLCDDNDL